MGGHIVRMMWVGIALAVGIGSSARGAGWTDGLFAELEHDFGPVPRGAKVGHTFVLTNRLAEPITIVHVRASCGCTAGRAVQGPIAPGQSAAVEAAMDTSSFAGRKTTSLFVTLLTAGGQESEVRLIVSSTSLSDIVLNPGTIDFGVVARGGAASRRLTIDRVGAPSWKAVRMISASKAIDASLVETARTATTVGYALTVTLKPEAPAGPLHDEIRILTNDPESPSIPILVTGLVQGSGLSATPAALALGKAASAAGAQGRFLVRAPHPFRILAVEGAGDGFQVAAAGTASKPTHVVTVTFRPAPGTPRGELRRTFRVRTDLHGEPPLELTATARAD